MKTAIDTITLACAAIGNAQTATECVGTIANTLWTCDCNNQVFVGNGCSQAFVCNGDGNNGCLASCASGQGIRSVFGDNNEVSFQCIDNVPAAACPGNFMTVCASDAVNPNGALPSRCDSEGQVFGTANCRTASTCTSSGVDHVNCGAGNQITVKGQNRDVECSADADNCPGRGGFTFY